MIYILAVIGAVILALAAGVYRLTSRWGRYRAVASALFALVALVLCWPIPGHGTFTFLGEVFFGELLSLWEERQEQREEQRHAAFIAEQTERFADRLAFGATARVAPGWQQGRSPEGQAFWLDEKSGLIWSDALPMPEVAPDAVLPEARRTCAAIAPPGVWALPTDAEGYFLWRNGGEKILPRRRGRFVSERLDTDFERSMPVIRIVGGGAARRSGQEQDRVPWAVRCVALGRTAPRRGYLDLDVAREDWNAYQLAKLGR